MKPENAFINRVHKLLTAPVYAEKMHNAYRGGTPDVFYEGDVEDLWIEYKWVPKLPVRKETQLKLDLSELQKLWLKRRYHKAREVWVVLGYKEGIKTRACIFSSPEGWTRAYNAEELSNKSISIEALAERIKATTCY